MTSHKDMNEKLLEEMVEKQSEIALAYGTLLNQATTQELRNTALSILNEEHMLQMEMMDEQKKRGWRNTANASPAQLESEWQKLRTP